MKRAVLNLAVFLLLALLLIAQTDETGVALFNDYHGLMYAIGGCMVMAIINACVIVVYMTNEDYFDDADEEHY